MKKLTSENMGTGAIVLLRPITFYACWGSITFFQTFKTLRMPVQYLINSCDSFVFVVSGEHSNWLNEDEMRRRATSSRYENTDVVRLRRPYTSLTHTHTHTHTHKHTDTHTHKHKKHMHTHTHSCTHTHAHIKHHSRDLFLKDKKITIDRLFQSENPSFDKSAIAWMWAVME